MTKPVVIAVCGSSRHKQLIHEICDGLSDAGFFVLKPPLYDIDEAARTSTERLHQLAWKGATLAHFHRITKSDFCLFVNVGGYLGVSSSLELGFAAANGKIVLACEHDAELAREGLFDRVLGFSTAQDVVREVCAALRATAQL